GREPRARPPPARRPPRGRPLGELGQQPAPRLAGLARRPGTTRAHPARALRSAPTPVGGVTPAGGHDVAVSGSMTDVVPRTVTAEDVAWLNRRLLIRSAGFARTTGVGLVIVGVVGAVGWLW